MFRDYCNFADTDISYALTIAIYCKDSPVLEIIKLDYSAGYALFNAFHHISIEPELVSNLKFQTRLSDASFFPRLLENTAFFLIFN